MTIRGPLGARRAPATRVWVPLAASAFLAWFCPLLFCDFRQPSSFAPADPPLSTAGLAEGLEKALAGASGAARSS